MGNKVDLHVVTETRGAGECRSCHARIYWFKLVSGRSHPFNTDVYLRTYHDDDRQLIGVINSDDSHFATCPQSKDWSRRR